MIFLLMPLLLIFASCQNQSPNEDKKIEVSVAIGDLFWERLQEYDVAYDLDTVIRTLKQNKEGNRTPQKRPRQVIADAQTEKLEESAYIELSKGDTILKNLSKEENMVSIASGKVIYQIIQKGSPPSISENSTPLVHLVEKDINGTIIFSTRETKRPLQLNLSETILGFKLGMIGMEEGERRTIYVHPKLSYKKLGKTSPQQLLVYDVEVIENR